MITDINHINTNTENGRLLMAALAILTCNKVLSLNGKVRNGSKMTPFAMLKELNKKKNEMFDTPIVVNGEEPRETALLRHAANEIDMLNEVNRSMTNRLRMFDDMLSIVRAVKGDRNEGLCSPSQISISSQIRSLLNSN